MFFFFVLKEEKLKKIRKKEKKNKIKNYNFLLIPFDSINFPTQKKEKKPNNCVVKELLQLSHFSLSLGMWVKRTSRSATGCIFVNHSVHKLKLDDFKKKKNLIKNTCRHATRMFLHFSAKSIMSLLCLWLKTFKKF